MRQLAVALLALALLAAPLAVEAQPAGKVYRVGYLSNASATASAPFVEALRQGLRELGWAEGQNIVIEPRFAEGRSDLLPALAAELVRLKVDLIVAGPSPPARAPQNPYPPAPLLIVALRRPRPVRTRREPRARRGECHGFGL